MASTDYSIPRGSLVLVTGANGYIASHVVDILLELGYNVRGTVRSKKPWLDHYFQTKHGIGRYESVLVPVIETEGAMDAAMKDVAGVLHIASDLSLNTDPNKVIPQVTAATLNVLESARRQDSVKRFVLTSSSTAAIIPQPNQKGVVVTEDTWNDAAAEAAWSEKTPESQKAYAVYAASKTEGERQAWKWVAEKKPGFVLNTIVPNINFGKILIPEIGGGTMGFVRNILKGDSSVIGFLPAQWFVNVRDDARLHVAALLDPKVQSQRLFAFAEPQNWTDVLRILRKLRPENTLIPSDPENEGRDLSEVPPSKKAEQLLKSFFGKGWTGLEESIADGIEDLK
ncbi:hypothetical protein B7463_g1306, partial [Scytalidium lignicola]